MSKPPRIERDAEPSGSVGIPVTPADPAATSSAGDRVALSADPPAAPADPIAEAHMARALALAGRAAGRVSPNPPVGAVIVRGGTVVGEGFTQPPGGPHAEIVALRQAGPAARGATLYVTLEPCCHHGRTPPCTDAIVAAGIARVHFAVRDPNPRVDGGGAAALRAAGVEVIEGAGKDGADAAHRRLAPFARWIATGRPLVTLKYAMTLDGRIATRAGDSRWVSGPASRRRVHGMRNAADAILAGAGTIIADDPLLTTRLDGPPSELTDPRDVHHPLRVILDSHGRVPSTARVFDPNRPAQTLLACVDVPPAHARALAARGIEIVRLPAAPDGRVALDALLDLLGERGVLDLLVEGGAAVHGAFLDAGLADRVCAFVAPKLVGGAAAPGPIGGAGVPAMAQAARLAEVNIEIVGEDVLVEGVVTPARAMGRDQEATRLARATPLARRVSFSDRP